MPRRRRVLAILALLLVGLGLGWALRHVPRIWLEATLGERLQARVEIGRLRLPGLKGVRLERLRVSEVAAWPQISEIEVASLRTALHARRLWRGDLESLQLEGVRIRAAAPCDGQPPAVVQPFEARIEELELVDAVLTLASPGGESFVHLQLEATSIGAQAGQGEIRLRSDLVDLRTAALLLVDPFALCAAPSQAEAPLTATLRQAGLQGHFDLARSSFEGDLEAESASALHGDLSLQLEDLRQSWRFDGAGAAAVGQGTTSVRELAVQLGEHRFEGAATELRAELENVAGRRLALTPVGEDLGRTRIELELAESGFTPHRVRASALDLPAQAWLPLLAPLLGTEISRVDGHFDLSIEGAPEAFDYTVEARLDGASLSFGDRHLETGPARVEHRGRMQEGSWQGPAAAELELRSIEPLEQPFAPQALFPLRLHIDGSLSGGPELELDGALDLHTPGLGRGRARGRLALPASRPGTELKWQWAVTDPTPWLDAAALGELGIDLELRDGVLVEGRIDGMLEDPALQANAVAEIAGRASGADDWQWRGAPTFHLSRASGSSQLDLRIDDPDARLRLRTGLEAVPPGLERRSHSRPRGAPAASRLRHRGAFTARHGRARWNLAGGAGLGAPLPTRQPA